MRLDVLVVQLDRALGVFETLFELLDHLLASRSVGIVHRLRAVFFLMSAVYDCVRVVADRSLVLASLEELVALLFEFLCVGRSHDR